LYKFDYVIDMNVNERITIIHGPNGCGKTNLLKFLDKLFNKKFWDLREIPFRVNRIVFDSGEELRIFSTFFQMAREYLNDPFYEKILPLWDIHDFNSIFFEVLSQKDTNWRKIFCLKQAGFVEVDPLTDAKYYDLDEQKQQINKYSLEYPDDKKNLKVVFNRITFSSKARGKLSKQKKNEIGIIPTVIQDICDKNKIFFIQTQRIITFDKKQDMLPINELVKCSEELKRGIIKSQKNVKKLNLQFSKEIQRKFKYQPVLEKNYRVPSLEEIKRQLSDKSEWFWMRLYWEAPLLLKSDEKYPYFEIDFNNFFGVKIPLDNDQYLQRYALGLFIQHLDNVIISLNDYDEKIFLFKDLLDELYLKEFVISSNGLEVIYDPKTGSELIPVKLSSGEQHFFILFFDLLFRAKKESLVLIDEPELSLHIHWQRKFLRILKRIITANPMDLLIATHSPDIVFDRRDLSTSLKGDK
jgi:energy-coupling factor transporter ATP-binding protein EcfA2